MVHSAANIKLHGGGSTPWWQVGCHACDSLPQGVASTSFTRGMASSAEDHQGLTSQRRHSPSMHMTLEPPTAHQKASQHVAEFQSTDPTCRASRGRAGAESCLRRKALQLSPGPLIQWAPVETMLSSLLCAWTGTAVPKLVSVDSVHKGCQQNAHTS